MGVHFCGLMGDGVAPQANHLEKKTTVLSSYYLIQGVDLDSVWNKKFDSPVKRLPTLGNTPHNADTAPSSSRTLAIRLGDIWDGSEHEVGSTPLAHFR